MNSPTQQLAEPRDRILANFAAGWETRYVRWKLRNDPLYAAAEKILTGNHLPLLDIGCGMGLLGIWLAEHGWPNDYLGVDNDARKIERSSAIAARAYPHLHFAEADADHLPSFSGNVAILDALHYMPWELQARVLDAAAERVAPDGVFLVRSGLRDASWRYFVTQAEERILHWSGWMRVTGYRFPSREQLVAPMERHGLGVEVSPLWGRTPYNSYLLVGRRGA